MTAELQAPARPLGSWTIGVVGMAGLAAIIAGVYTSREVLVGVAVATAAAIGVGWPHFLRIPAKKTLAAVIAVPGAGAALGAGLAPAPGYLDWTPAFIALGMIAVFVVQLIRGTGQAQRLESTLGCCVGVLLACLGSGWIAGARFNGVREMLLVAAISAAVALLAGLIRWPDSVVAPLGIVLAGLAGPLAGLVFSDIAVLPAAIFGVVVGAVLASFRRLVTLRGAPLNIQAALSMGLAPVSAVGSLAYFIDKLLIY
ncbi:permease [Arthrobacter sp. PGP41]|uniref:permease n=1 Tax=unclassified Arthrobacter TaxID=235627 RepID=UPI000CDC5D1D|nr:MULTISPECIES: permease [unclassified Arthrobacter]AUZ35525.1 permease [Arthrobacter sp. PGP41]MDT0195097.1 permease [Arthrobacter sp. AB6]